MASVSVTRDSPMLIPSTLTTSPATFTVKSDARADEALFRTLS